MAYAELAVEDLEQAQRDLGAGLVASLIFGVCMLFLVFTACLAVVALTWDTPYRVTAIACMAGVFLVIALVAGLKRARVIGSKSRFLGTVRREWAEDRVILEKILSEQE